MTIKTNKRFVSCYVPRIGDIVTLNVGSPAMTVVDFDLPDQVTVSFRNDAGCAVEMTTVSTALNCG